MATIVRAEPDDKQARAAAAGVAAASLGADGRFVTAETTTSAEERATPAEPAATLTADNATLAERCRDELAWHEYDAPSGMSADELADWRHNAAASDLRGMLATVIRECRAFAGSEES